MFHKILALLFIMTSLLTFGTYIADAQDGPLAIVTDGLASYWPLDEIKAFKVKDIVGENDGTVNGKPKIVEGKYGNALEFDGKKDYILVLTNNFNSGNQPMTTTAWLFLKNKGRGGPAWHGLVSLAAPIGEAGKCFWVYAYTGRRRGVNQIRMTQCVDNGPFDAKGPDLTLNEWHHVAAVYNGAKKNILYLDGVEVATREIPKEPDVQMNFHPDGSGIIGADSKRPVDYFWEGLIDEVGFYNRALTPEEVLKNATAPQLFAVEPLGKLSLTWAKIKAAR